MKEYEEKYKLFGLNDDLTKSFRDYAYGINGVEKKAESFVIKTIIIDKKEHKTVISEINNAKLV